MRAGFEGFRNFERDAVGFARMGCGRGSLAEEAPTTVIPASIDFLG